MVRRPGRISERNKRLTAKSDGFNPLVTLSLRLDHWIELLDGIPRPALVQSIEDCIVDELDKISQEGKTT